MYQDLEKHGNSQAVQSMTTLTPVFNAVTYMYIIRISVFKTAKTHFLVTKFKVKGYSNIRIT